MSLSDLASLGSFVSGVAVLISLIYLAMQVRQATKHARAAIGQNWITRLVDIQFRQAEPALSEIVRRGRDGDETMSVPEVSRFMSYARAQFWTAEDNFIQHKNRMLPDVYMRSLRATTVGLMRGAGAQAAWDIFRQFFEPEFVAYMDDVAREAEASGYTSIPGNWTALVARHKAAQTGVHSVQSNDPQAE